MNLEDYSPFHLTESFHHSEDQREALLGTVGIAVVACHEHFATARRLHDTLKELPFTNPDGTTVRNGANNNVRTVRDGYISAALAFSHIINRDHFDYIKWKHRYVGSRFVSEETFLKEYSHLIPEMDRIRDALPDCVR